MATKHIDTDYSPYFLEPIEIKPEIEKCYFNPDSVGGAIGFSTQGHTSCE